MQEFSRSGKNKTHKNLILKHDERINLPVARVTAFETDEGIGNRCGDTRKRELTGGC
jgi:hypothetical protein